MTGLGTYWRTVRHLRPQQVLNRIGRHFSLARPDLRPAPTRRRVASVWIRPARRTPSVLPSLVFSFLNESHALDEVGWDNLAIAKLWRYNQHYFDDLNAWHSNERTSTHTSLITRWIAENPPAAGTGWEPYPVSLRVVNWIKWSLCGHDLTEAAMHSLAIQVRWLSMRLETHLLGNHLFANAKALVFAGLYFEGAEPASWLRLGTHLLERELREQILPDGGQFERSPMYHALALEDVLDLLNLADAFAGSSPELPQLRSALAAWVPSMLRWLLAMSHPDGSLGQFNDTAQGIAPTNDELLRLAASLGFDVTAEDNSDLQILTDSGYVRVSRPPMVALIDVAPVGPDYLPGHGHADTLSFELSLGGLRVIVNGGTSCYGSDTQRQHERSTAAHSTVEVAGQDSSEVWAGFRVGRRARPARPHARRVGDALEVNCSHDGYAHLNGRPIHTRTWAFNTGCLTVTDDVSNKQLPAKARYHFAPGLELSAGSPNAWTIYAGAAMLGRVEVRHGRAHTEPSTHAPQFGMVLPVQCLAVDLLEGRAVTHWSWHQ